MLQNVEDMLKNPPDGVDLRDKNLYAIEIGKCCGEDWSHLYEDEDEE